MASIKIAYIGGGSSRAAGTMASFLAHGKEFDGSHVVLIDQRHRTAWSRANGSHRSWPVARGSTSRSPRPRTSAPA